MERLPLSTPRLVGIALAGSLVIGAAVFFQPTLPEATQQQPELRPSQEPDLLIEDAVIRDYRETGALRYLLRSPLIEHFEGEALTHLREPDLLLHDPPEPPWQITARRGVIRNAAQGRRGVKEEVELKEDVQMLQVFDDGRRYDLRTPMITIYPDREYAETDQNVMITTHAGRTKAVGLEGSLGEGLLKMFSNDEQRVHTVILPHQFK
jgi:lipopolysaccharide export system protein LptC